MILEKGDMWSQWGKTDLWLFTGNSYINKKCELVMGRGLALEVKTKFPALPRYLGGYIKSMRGGHLGVYGFIPWNLLGEDNIGVFQVKRHFRDNAELSLIGYSVITLKQHIERFRPDRVDLNCPGTGYGRLARRDVLPIISELPDCVHVWERK